MSTLSLALVALVLTIAPAACGAEPSDLPPVRAAPSAVPAPAPDLILDGQVVDDRGQPVPDVHVLVGTRELLTDGGGRFEVRAPAPGRYDVAVQERVDGRPSGVVPRGAATTSVVMPTPASHDIRLVVRRVGPIAWSKRPRCSMSEQIVRSSNDLFDGRTGRRTAIAIWARRRTTRRWCGACSVLACARRAGRSR